MGWQAMHMSWQAIERAKNAEITELKTIIRELITHPLVSIGIEDDENSDLLTWVKKARRATGSDQSAPQPEKDAEV